MIIARWLPGLFGRHSDRDEKTLVSDLLFRMQKDFTNAFLDSQAKVLPGFLPPFTAQVKLSWDLPSCTAFRIQCNCLQTRRWNRKHRASTGRI
jgi:hypothetical protein